MTSMTIAGLIIGLAWTASLIYAHGKGYLDGHKDGFWWAHSDDFKEKLRELERERQ